MEPFKEKDDQVIRVSLAAVAGLAFAMVVLGILGGLLAQWWGGTSLPPLAESQDRLITTIQEVTISPSTATAELVKNHERSVVLLARASAPESTLASGLVVTSDGLVATTASLPDGEIISVDSEGRRVPLTPVGQDAVYNITYLRAGSGVFSPFDVRDSDVGVGSILTLVSRNPETLAARVRAIVVEEYRLPERPDAVGWQRLIGARELTESLLVGSPLLDDEGRVSALVLPGGQGRLLPGIYLRRSLERVARGELERTDVAAAGLALDYIFHQLPEAERGFAAVVEGVTAGGVAAESGIRAGDVITAINGKPVTWDSDIIAAFAEQPVSLSIRRGEETLVATLGPSVSEEP